MANITWTPQALKDLQAIEQYYQQAAPDFAGIIVNSLLEATKRLEPFPESGRIVPEIGDESIREILHRKYRIVYYVADNNVDILTLFHAAKEF